MVNRVQNRSTASQASSESSSADRGGEGWSWCGNTVRNAGLSKKGTLRRKGRRQGGSYTVVAFEDADGDVEEVAVVREMW